MAGGSLILNDTEEELVRELIAAGVRFVIVGGRAEQYYGIRQFTADTDIWVEPSETNARKVAAALQSLRIEVSPTTAEKLALPNKLIRLEGIHNNIDILTSIEGVIFEEALKAAAYHDQQSDKPIPVLSEEHLRVTKSLRGNEP